MSHFSGVEIKITSLLRLTLQDQVLYHMVSVNTIFYPNSGLLVRSWLSKLNEILAPAHKRVSIMRRTTGPTSSSTGPYTHFATDGVYLTFESPD